jgi:8-oxo-dGTP pyrophosphatase MutT (NUDIX family)
MYAKVITMRASIPILHDQAAIKDYIRAVLSGRERRIIPTDGLKPAAVLVPLGWLNGDPCIVLTKRSMSVETHKGEISFPGGHTEPSDTGPEATALREAEEEIGLKPEHVEILGRLDDHITIFRFHVIPVVGVIPCPYPFRMNGEADAIVTVRLADALLDNSWMSEKTTLRGMDVEFSCIPADEGFVWGATARMLRHFVELLIGRELKTRPLSEEARTWIAGIVGTQERYTQKL